MYCPLSFQEAQEGIHYPLQFIISNLKEIILYPAQHCSLEISHPKPEEPA